jgi:hypothetical protein
MIVIYLQDNFEPEIVNDGFGPYCPIEFLFDLSDDL